MAASIAFHVNGIACGIRQRPSKKERERENRGGGEGVRESGKKRRVRSGGERRAYVLRDSCAMSEARLLGVAAMLLPLAADIEMRISR